MRTPSSPAIASLLLALLFTFLFHNTGVGLNLLVFELAALATLLYLRRPRWTMEFILVFSGTILSAVLVVVHGSALAVWVNVLSLLLTVGVMLAPELHALHHSLWLTVRHLLPAQRRFMGAVGGTSLSANVPRLGRNNLPVLLGILVVVTLFGLLYQASNAHFEQLLTETILRIDRLLAWVEVSQVLTFALGLMVANTVILETRHPRLLQWMGVAQDDLLRRRHHRPLSAMLGLRYELRTGVLLLGLLNFLLLVVNALDIRHVWFGFTFDGQYLKQFVHEGTWLLIVSILLGVVIVLWFFRANQNFHSGNRLLKTLAWLWLAQNAVLAVSVAIRNYWYIHHYALAYKRIGVLFFLLACLVGLVLVGLKVRHRRSAHYLLRWNAVSIYAILMLSACVNWDILIARYNFAKKDQSFVHLDFMATLADKALPWLAHEQRALELIHQHNQRVVDSDSFSRSMYIEPKAYGALIAERTARFLEEYPLRSWREWNVADARAYRLLDRR
jgi:hypothetical protein